MTADFRRECFWRNSKPLGISWRECQPKPAPLARARSIFLQIQNCGHYTKKFGLISSRILTDKCVPRALRATTQGVVLLKSRSAGNAKPNTVGAKQSIFCGRKGFALPRLIFSKLQDSDFRRVGGCVRNARRGNMDE